MAERFYDDDWTIDVTEDIVKDSEANLIEILTKSSKSLNGGRGSGNFGHAGIPGKRGGSAKFRVVKTKASTITLTDNSSKFIEHDKFYKSFNDIYKDIDIPQVENSYNGKSISSKKVYVHSKDVLVNQLKPEVTDKNRVQEIKDDFLKNNKYSAILMVEDNKNFKIADGNHTAQAMKELAKTEDDFYIPVILTNQKNLKNWEDKFPSKTSDTEAYSAKKDYETIIRSSK